MNTRIIIFLFISISKICFSLENPDLQELWQQEIDNPSNLDPKMLAGKHVIFVSGFMNELADLISSYFIEARHLAKELGATVTYINPPSSQSIIDNSYMLYDEIIKIKKSTKKSIVLVCHSKAAPEIIHAILRNPELIIDRVVERVLLFQPAAFGSPMVHNKGGCLLRLVKFFLEPNFASLSPEQTLIDYNDSIIEYKKNAKKISLKNKIKKRDLFEKISHSIFIIRSQVNREDLSLGVKLILEVMCEPFNEYEPGDALLTLEAQLYKDIGTELGVVYADHVGLVISKVSKTSDIERRAIAIVGFKLMYGL